MNQDIYYTDDVLVKDGKEVSFEDMTPEDVYTECVGMFKYESKASPLETIIKVIINKTD